MGNFGTTEKRFKNMGMIDEKPGPGAYLDVIPEKDGEDVQLSCIFKSNADRQLFKKLKGKINSKYYKVKDHLLEHMN